MGKGCLGLIVAASITCGCLAPPPPIVVETPFGDVRARSESKAVEVAELLVRLAPEVRALLPGAQNRPIDVWVQDELAVYLFHDRPESVRGFTLLEDEFSAKRIHLQEGGQSPWYLAHELVHALIDPSWAPLPGILEEGLGDVVAESLNPEYENHIRSHRLLNASAFTGGLSVEVVYRDPDSVQRREIHSRQQLVLAKKVEPGTLEHLLRTPRSQLHERWADIPESFYGISWLIVSRAVERIGIDGLHDLCLRATASGLDIIPLEWLASAADLDFDRLDPDFLAACFDRTSMQTALYLQPEAFAAVLLDALWPLHGGLQFREVIYKTRPVIRLWNRSEVPLGPYNGPLFTLMRQGWQTVPTPPRAVAASSGS